MSVMTSQVTDFSIVCSTVCSGANQRKHKGSASLAFLTSDRWVPSQRASTENVFIWWRHHEGRQQWRWLFVIYVSPSRGNAYSVSHTLFNHHNSTHNSIQAHAYWSTMCNPMLWRVFRPQYSIIDLVMLSSVNSSPGALGTKHRFGPQFPRHQDNWHAGLFGPRAFEPRVPLNHPLDDGTFNTLVTSSTILRQWSQISLFAVMACRSPFTQSHCLDQIFICWQMQKRKYNLLKMKISRYFCLHEFL